MDRVRFIASSAPDPYPNVALEIHLKEVAKELGLDYRVFQRRQETG